MKNENMEIVARYSNENLESCIALYDFEKDYCYFVNLTKPQATKISNVYYDGLVDLVDELINASDIEFIHNEYIGSIEQEIFENDYIKEKAYNLLRKCYYNKKV